MSKGRRLSTNGLGNNNKGVKPLLMLAGNGNLGNEKRRAVETFVRDPHF